MAALSKEIQNFIVQQLACFESPTEIVEAVKAEFGITVTRQSVAHYDPTKGGKNKRLAKDHKALFELTRAQFTASFDALAISHKAYRLNQLEMMMRTAKRQRNFQLAAQLLKQAAEEIGGVYTNRREHSGPGGGPIPVSLEDQKKALAEKAFRKLVQGGKSQAEARLALLSIGVDEHDIPAA